MDGRRFIVVEDGRIRNEFDHEEDAINRVEELYIRYHKEALDGIYITVPTLSYYEHRGTK